MVGEIYDLAVEHPEAFVDGIGEEEASIKNGEFGLRFGHELTVEPDGSCGCVGHGGLSLGAVEEAAIAVAGLDAILQGDLTADKHVGDAMADLF